MKISNKILSIILAIMMVISIVPISASAAEPILTISTDKSTIIIGDVITVNVIISDNSQIGALTVDLVYDSSVFEAISMISYGIFSSKDGESCEAVNYNYSNNKARFTGAVADTIVDGGVLFTVELKVLKTSDSTISIDVVEAIDADWNEVILETNSVAIKAGVECKHEIMSNWAVIKNATCKEDGVITRNCTVCDYSEIQFIPATGEHICGEWFVVIEPTCKEFGVETRICTVCDYSETKSIPSTNEHTYSEWVIDKEPTCGETGNRSATCTVCGCFAVEIGTIPATGEHIYTWYTISVATCETDGVMIGECSVCEDIDIIANAKLGHNFINGVCQRCGSGEENGIEPETPAKPENTEFTFSLKEPSRTSIRHKDGIILHANIDGTLPEGAYIKWTTDNDNFDIEESADGKSLTIISKNNGDTTITATVYDSSENILVTDTINMTSKAGFFDKIGSFFRSLFGGTEIYEN